MIDKAHAWLDSEDGVGLAERVAAGDVSPLELVEATIERLEAVNPTLNAVAERLYETARENARAPLPEKSMLAGVPTLIKDLFSPLRGAVMSNGSLATGEARMDLDCEVVARMKKAGCLILGTSTSPEFGTSYTTESTRFGATGNPWDPSRSAGGSSGGAAALVAARVVPFAHGNDGGGSLRVPASCCGVFGFKPSRGLMPSGPMVGEGWGGMGTPHAITRTVRDSAALLDVVAGMDVGAPYAAPIAPQAYATAPRREPGPLRIGVFQTHPWDSSDDAGEVVQYTARLCERLGHRLENVVLPVDLMELYDRCFDIIAPSTQHYLETLGQLRGQPVRPEELEPRTRIILRERGRIPAVGYVAAIDYMHALGRRMAALMQDYDVLMCPTLTRPPARIGELDAFDDRLTLEEVIERFHSYSPFTALFNATGQPAMSVPLYWNPEGLPMGSHFAAGFGNESLLLSLAAQLERAAPWAERIPPVNALMTAR